MPETQEQINERNRQINRALEGLGNTSSNDKQQRSSQPGAPSTTPAPSQLPVDEAERRAMADAVRRFTNSGRK
jgi:hypothetical protein